MTIRSSNRSARTPTISCRIFCGIAVIGKRVQFHDETWQELQVLAAESMKSFQELADEAFRDLLKKHGRPASLKEALRRSAGETALVVPLKGKLRGARKKR